jgi:hypothetical protein
LPTVSGASDSAVQRHPDRHVAQIVDRSPIVKRWFSMGDSARVAVAVAPHRLWDKVILKERRLTLNAAFYIIDTSKGMYR